MALMDDRTCHCTHLKLCYIIAYNIAWTFLILPTAAKCNITPLPCIKASPKAVATARLHFLIEENTQWSKLQSSSGKMNLVLTVLFVVAACNVYQAFALPLHNFAAAEKHLDQAQNEKSAEVERFYGYGHRKVIAMILDEMKKIKKQRLIQEEREMNSAKAEGFGYDGYRTVQEERDMTSAKVEGFRGGYGYGYGAAQEERDMNSAEAKGFRGGFGGGG